MRWHQAVNDVWQVESEDVRHRARFLVLLSFLLTFGVVRFITYGIREQWGGFLHNLTTPSGVHLHHMMFMIVGIALLLAVGYESDHQALPALDTRPRSVDEADTEQQSRALGTIGSTQSDIQARGGVGSILSRNCATFLRVEWCL